VVVQPTRREGRGVVPSLLCPGCTQGEGGKEGGEQRCWRKGMWENLTWHTCFSCAPTLPLPFCHTPPACHLLSLPLLLANPACKPGGTGGPHHPLPSPFSQLSTPTHVLTPFHTQARHSGGLPTPSHYSLHTTCLSSPLLPLPSTQAVTVLHSSVHEAPAPLPLHLFHL
jgi:hypothetical protein